MKLDELLKFAVEKRASDLHISAGLPPMIRVDGEMKRIKLPVFDALYVSKLIDDILTEEQLKQLRQRREIDFALVLRDIARFRVNVFYQHRGISAAFRIISNVKPTLKTIDSPKVFKEILQAPNGLIIVTGPTGSGKSTTLAAMIDYLNENKRQHILTIEDPIEFVHQSKYSLINQREVYRDTLSFADALRSGLREDPDIIMVGEMRDLETVRLALTAAETGHLVLATLHTASASKTVDRIIDIFPGEEVELVRSILSESLRAVVAQTLVKKAKGKDGQTAAWEVMIATPAIKNLIREDKAAQIYSLIQTGRSHGMQTLDQHLLKLCQKGVVDYEQARLKAMDKSYF
ncbi:MAG: twitching motility protein PilT [Gammaproteobacteria bacterium]|nr:MAG: twitching motility protein PilT [Gammaproteobacteria bacterium]